MARVTRAGGFDGAPDRSRTCDLWLRKPTLYPTELRAHAAHLTRRLVQRPPRRGRLAAIERARYNAAFCAQSNASERRRACHHARTDDERRALLFYQDAE